MSKEATVLTTSARETNRLSHTITWRCLAALLAIVMVGPSVGCRNSTHAIRDAVFVSYRDMVWARRAYNLRYGNCTRPYCEHFEAGFCAGYSDICGGGDGYVPALPPGDYRSYQYQSAEGEKCINAWFEGYPAGVAAAKKERVGEFNDILISRMIDSAVTQSEAKSPLPSDVPVLDANKSNVPPPPTTSAPPAPTSNMSYSMPSTSPVSNASYTAPPVTGASYTTPPVVGSGVPQQMSGVPSLPPIVTGNGAMPQENNTPLPMAVNPAGWESNRRGN